MAVLDKEINDDVEKYAFELGTEKNYLEMDCEKKFTKLVFLGVKKRYIGYADFWKGKFVSKPILIVKGLDLVRRELSPRLKVIIKDIIVMFLEGKDKHDIKKYYNDAISTIRSTPIHELAWAKGLSKDMNDYTKVLPQHVKGCWTSKQYLGIDFMKNDSPRLMYIKPLPVTVGKKIIYSDVIAFNMDTEIPKKILDRIDYDRFIQSFIVNKLDDFCGVKGMDMDFVINENTTIFDF